MSDNVETVEDSKAYKAFVKEFGEGLAAEFLNLDEKALKETISYHATYEEELMAELRQNPKYAAAKEVIKDLSGAARDTLKPSKAKAKLAAVVLVAGAK